jgi:hypothetical protein
MAIQGTPVSETIRNSARKKGRLSKRKGARGPVISGGRWLEFDGGAQVVDNGSFLCPALGNQKSLLETIKLGTAGYDMPEQKQGHQQPGYRSYHTLRYIGIPTPAYGLGGIRGRSRCESWAPPV